MKDFAEAYKAAHAKAREYTGAKRAGWAEPGKRTRENHAILIPRKEAVDTANNLATAIYAKSANKKSMRSLPWINAGLFLCREVARSDRAEKATAM